MNGMNRIEFFHHPWDDHPSALVWGIRVDGADLRAHTAWATRELWRPELDDQFEDQERESAELIWHGHGGLGVRDFEDRPDHFLTDTGVDAGAGAGPGADAGAGSKGDSGAGAVPLLGCPCGLWFCWPLMARVALTPATVTWSRFHYPEREDWGELPLGPFVFERTVYETALRSPAVLPEDPLGPAPAGLGV